MESEQEMPDTDKTGDPCEEGGRRMERTGQSEDAESRKERGRMQRKGKRRKGKGRAGTGLFLSRNWKKGGGGGGLGVGG